MIDLSDLMVFAFGLLLGARLHEIGERHYLTQALDAALRAHKARKRTGVRPPC